MDHLTDALMDELIRDTLGPDQQTAAMHHLDTCSECMQRLATYHERLPELFGKSVFAHRVQQSDYRESFIADMQAAASGLRATRLEPTQNVSLLLNRGDSIGLGGFGQVFEYLDEQFGRRVAFKILQDRWVGNPEIVRRFLREMQITSRIDHPGCPTVYGAGRTSDGRDFFWMQLVTGEPFSELIHGIHQSGSMSLRRGDEQLRDLLSMFLKISETIAVAHDKGVWHRDLKPANIRLHENRYPVVLDWGLAVCSADAGVESSAGSAPAANESAELTRSGDQAGSPRYISPEAARGETHAINHRTDVYSLGGILYEILTGCAPHAELLRAVSSPSELKRAFAKIGCGQLPSFSGLPAELASICRKAMACDPDARYAAARDLARDVDRWMAGEAVTAHRYGVAGRAMLAIARRPLIFAASTLFTALTTCLLILAAQWQSEAVQQRSIADQRFGRALEAWKTLVTGVQDSLGAVGGTGLVRQQLIAEATEGIEQLILDAGRQPGAELVIIQARLELAHIRRKERGEYAEARNDYAELKKQLESLTLTHQLPERYKLIGDAIKNMYYCTLALDGIDQANRFREELSRHAEEFRQKYPAEPTAILMQAQCATLAGRYEEDRGPDFLPQALVHFQTAERLLLSLPESLLRRPVYQYEYLISLTEQARVLRYLGDIDKAIALQQRVVDEMTGLKEREPVRRYRIGLIEDQMTLANMFRKKDPQQAVRLLTQVAAETEELHRNSPTDTEVRNLHRDARQNLATAFRGNQEPEKAAEILESTRNPEIFRQLNTADMESLTDQAWVHATLGTTYRDLSRREQANKCFRGAIELRREIWNRDKNNTGSLRELLVVAQAWAATAPEMNSTSAGFLGELCLLVDADNHADHEGSQFQMQVANLYRWYGEHMLDVAQTEASLDAARKAEVAYGRSKHLLGRLDGVPPAKVQELSGRLVLVKELIKSLDKDASSL